MTNISAAEDGNPDQFEDKKINVDKVAMIGYTLRIVRNLQGVDFNKKIKGKVTPLLKHLANIPRWSEEQLNQASESIKPRKAIDDAEQSGSAELSTPGTDESGSDHGIEVVRVILCTLVLTICDRNKPEPLATTRTPPTWSKSLSLKTEWTPFR